MSSQCQVVLSVIGTRPEAIKMAPVIKALAAAAPTIKSVVCSTGQHREMLDQVWNVFGIRPEFDLQVMTQDQTLAAVTARILERLDSFGTADLAPFRRLIERCIYLLFIEAAGQSARHYPGRYLRELERYSPFRLAALRRRRRQLARRQLAPAQLIDAFATTLKREA